MPDDTEHRRLFMVREGLNYPEFLSDRPLNYPLRRRAEPSEITAEAMADLMDQDAEGANQHNLVGCHSGLAILLGRQVGDEQATEIMRQILDQGGISDLKDFD